jgi:protein-S-isoprenylcysteine O-methyltransferase Ste14
MRIIIVIEWAVFLLVSFGLRSWIHWRATGRSGLVGVRSGARAWEWGAAGAMLAALLLTPVGPWVGQPLWAGTSLVGQALALAGAGLTLLAQLQMGTSWRVGVATSERTTLVTTGVFAWVRNPVFSAMLIASLGLSLSRPTPLAVLLPLILWISLQVQVRWVEEPHLTRAFGPEYRSWAARTGRFLPWFGRLSSATCKVVQSP